jgi:hypothetical protein
MREVCTQPGTSGHENPLSERETRHVDIDQSVARMGTMAEPVGPYILSVHGDDDATPKTVPGDEGVREPERTNLGFRTHHVTRVRPGLRRSQSSDTTRTAEHRPQRATRESDRPEGSMLRAPGVQGSEQ